MNEEKLLDRISINPKIFGGKPTVRGHRLTVENILGMLAAGDTFETLQESYPWLEREDVQACLVYARRLVGNERIELLLRESPVPSLSQDSLKSGASVVAEKIPYLKLLVLFGSRAKGNANEDSDWDFAVLYDQELRKIHQKSGWDWLKIWSVLEEVFDLPSNRVDVVILNDCSNIMAHCVARDGKLLYERELSEFEQFKQQALMNSAELKAFREQQRAKIKESLKRLLQ